MRILAITNLYPRPKRPLIAAFNRQQLRALAQNHEVRVVAPVGWPNAIPELLKHGRSPSQYVNDDGILVAHPTFYYPPRIWRGRHGRLLTWSIRHAVGQALREFRPDVLLGCFAYPDGWAAVRLARQVGLPVAIKVHGSDVRVLEHQRSTRPRLIEALRAADRVVAVSGDLAKQVANLGAAQTKVRVVHNGVDGERFSRGDQGAARERLGLPRGEKAVVFVGHLLLSKGAGVLIEACRLLRGGEAARQRDRDWSKAGADATNRFICYLIGSGGHERKLRSMIASYGLNERVRLVGSCPHDQLPDWFRASDVVALPSFSEGIPNVLREALACGRPFVATRVGGIPEIAHPSFSRLVEPGDAAGLADALAAMLAEPPVVDAALVARCNMTWRESAEQLAEVLAAAVRSRGRDSKVGGEGAEVAPALVAGHGN
ncbi:MAG TPA: glycosyltransferase [Pirellulales bacterium]|nr:glycosyltransferase [Pirellulales bacterium]